MKHLILTVLFVVVSGFVTACGGDGSDSDGENSASQDNLCLLGNIELPDGTNPNEFVTPEGYRWLCNDGDAFRIYSNGMLEVILGTQSLAESRFYFSSCPGDSKEEEIGEWVVLDSPRHFCFKFEEAQPGAYQCREIINLDPGVSVSLSAPVGYDEDGIIDGREDSPVDCDLVEE
ncbi:MAG: hypothetical protein OXF23_04905 [Candidatus Dadabacteria bacterium]|nr:hypothetical protein [Candidatus Dadabacteria bacterium]